MLLTCTDVTATLTSLPIYSMLEPCSRLNNNDKGPPLSNHVPWPTSYLLMAMALPPNDNANTSFGSPPQNEQSTQQQLQTTQEQQRLSGPALPHSHVPLKGRFDTSYSLSRRISRYSSHSTVYTNAGMVHRLNVNNLELLSHNIKCTASLIPDLNKHFLLLFIYILIN